MRDMYRIKGLSVIAWWVVCSIFIWPLSAVAVAVIMLPLSIVLNVFEPLFYNSFFGNVVLALILIPMLGAIIGASMSSLQRWLLRSKLYWAADNWGSWSIAGGALGALLVAAVVFALDTTSSFEVYRGNTLVMIAMPIFLACVSAFQFVALRNAVKDAWLWILGNIVAGAVFGGLLVNSYPSRTDAGSGWNQIGVIMLAVCSLGLITGSVMLFLFEKKLLPMRAETSKAQKKGYHTPSVWDEAI